MRRSAASKMRSLGLCLNGAEDELRSRVCPRLARPRNAMAENQQPEIPQQMRELALQNIAAGNRLNRAGKVREAQLATI
jgi:hypothetical protein